MKRSMYWTICTPQKVSNMASDLIRVPRKIMKHHETMRFGSAKMGCPMSCAEGSFHLAIGSPSIPNFYRSFWSRIKSTSRSFWRLLQDSQVDLYVPRVLPSITTFRLWVVFTLYSNASSIVHSGGSCAHWGAQPLVLSGGLRSSGGAPGIRWSLSSDVWNSADPWVETR